MAAVPLLQGLLRVRGEVPLTLASRDFAPRRGVVQHEPDALRRLRERGVHRRGEGVDQLGPHRVEEPQEAAAAPAEIPLRRAAVLAFRGVDREVLPALDLQRARVCAEVDRVPPAPGGLAADRAVARLVRIERVGLDAEPDRSTMARPFEQHSVLQLRISVDVGACLPATACR